MLEQLFNLETNELVEQFNDFCMKPDEVQKKVLLEILDLAKDTEFGKKHNFSNIKSYEDYVANVSISDWTNYIHYSERMQNGEENITFRGKPAVFLKTSGTSGLPKLIPETNLNIKAKGITERLKQYYLFSFAKNVLKGKLFPLANAGTIGKTKCGIPFGTASGLTVMNASKQLLASLAFPPIVLKITDQLAQDYVMMRFSIEQDVRFILGNNVGRMQKLTEIANNYAEDIVNDIENGTISNKFKIDKDIKEQLVTYFKPNINKVKELKKLVEENKFIPKYYWPNFSLIATWLSGSIGNSAYSVRELFPENVIYFDFGYGASEGKFNIPHEPEKPEGILALHGAFFEFIPFENKNAKPVLAHQLEKGKYYELVVTTYSGLYRYKMKDIIKVEGFYKDTPEIFFVSKVGDVGDIAGERLPGSLITDRVVKVFNNFGITLAHICAVTVFSPPYYIFCVEPDERSLEKVSKLDLEQIEKELDNIFKNEIGYSIMRRDNLILEPKVKIMKQGWKDALIEEKAKNSNGISTIKLPVVYKDTIPCSSFIL